MASGGADGEFPRGVGNSVIWTRRSDEVFSSQRQGRGAGLWSYTHKLGAGGHPLLRLSRARLVTNAWYRQSGQNCAWSDEASAAITRRELWSDRFCGRINHTLFPRLVLRRRRRIVDKRDPGFLFDAGVLGFDPAIQLGRLRPDHTLKVESWSITVRLNTRRQARTLILPLAPDRRTRPIVSLAKWTTPRWDPTTRRRAASSPCRPGNAN